MEIKNITLISSCSCNLHCKYCSMEKNPNNKIVGPELQKNTIQALKDGTFLKNTKNVLLKLETNPTTIEHMEFWGQEPTLTLDLFTEHIQDWLTTFPNVHSWSFSTNNVANSNKILDFIEAVNKYSRIKARISIQISWDGELSTTEQRDTKSELILSNFKYIISELNKKNLNNCEVLFNVHGVVSRYLINQLDTVDKIKEYYINSYKQIYDIVILNTNKSVQISDSLNPGFENPMPATTDDGVAFASFFRKGRTLDPDELGYDYTPEALAGFVNYVPIKAGFPNISTNSQFLSNLLSLRGQEFADKLNQISSHIGCSPYVGEIKIMYDGTLLTCQSFMFDRDPLLIPNTHSVNDDVKQFLGEHHYFVNPLKEDITTANLQIMIDRFKQYKETSFIYVVYQCMILMYFLSKCRQIDVSYSLDKEKLFNHAVTIALLQQCPYNNTITTGTLFNRDSGFIRWYCNGILDEIEKMEKDRSNDIRRPNLNNF